MGQVVNSSVFIALERSRRGVDFLTSRLRASSLVIAAVIASELLVGVHRADSTDRRQRRQTYVEDVLLRMPLIPFDLAAARTHARLWADLSAAGQMIGPHDIIVAATALTLGYSVLTYKLRDFQRVPGLDVRQPTW